MDCPSGFPISAPDPVHSGAVFSLVAPERMLVDLISRTPVLHDGIQLVTGPGVSNIVPGILAAAKSCGVTKVRSAHRLYRFLNEAKTSSARYAVLIDYDPDIFLGAGDMVGPVGKNLANLAKTIPVILYSPVPDRVFRSLSSACAVPRENELSKRPGVSTSRYPGHHPALPAHQGNHDPGTDGCVGYYRCPANVPAV